MESFNKYSGLTDIQLNNKINEAKLWHDAIKKEIIDLTLIIEENEKLVNNKLELLENIEKNYVDLMKEMTERI